MQLRLSEDEYAAISGKKVKKSKYRSRFVYVDEIKFDSQKEANRYCELKALQRAGEVSHFHRQVIYDLGPKVTYRLDFLVFWMDGSVTHEDVKGVRTKEFITKKKLVEARYPIKILEL